MELFSIERVRLKITHSKIALPVKRVRCCPARKERHLESTSQNYRYRYTVAMCNAVFPGKSDTQNRPVKISVTVPGYLSKKE